MKLLQTSLILPLFFTLGCERAAVPEKNTDSLESGWSGRDTAGTQNGPPIEVSSALILEQGRRPKNLLWITVDTLRWDYYNAVGYTNAVITPNIDRILEGGVLLSKNRACAGWTMPSFLCSLSGQSQAALQTWPYVNMDGEVDGLFQGEFPGMASYLKAEGFNTGLVTAQWYISEAFGLATGHDVEYKYGAVSPDNTLELTDRVLELMGAQSGDTPWFFHVHYFDPHMPYFSHDSFEAEGCPPEFVSSLDNRDQTYVMLNNSYYDYSESQREVCMAHIKARYESEIRHVDQEIGRILDALEAGAGQDTLVVFFTDHGEAFDQRRGDYSFGWGHGSSLYDEMIGAVAAFYQPGNLKPAKVEKATSLIDVVPTSLALMGIATDQQFTGRVVDLESDLPQFHTVYRRPATIQSVTTTVDKLIFPWGCMAPQYFDLEADPQELNDLYDLQNPRVVELWELLRPKVVELDAAQPDWSPCNPY